VVEENGMRPLSNRRDDRMSPRSTSTNKEPMSKLIVVLALMAGASGAAGCVAGDPTALEAEVAAPSRVAEPVSVTLATVRLSPTHVVTFQEASDGDLEVLEKLHADEDRGRPSLAELDPGQRTLAELHEYLLPGARIPDALLAADARAEARERGDLDLPPADDAFTVDDRLGPSAADSILWDWAADEAWFRQYFYVGGTGGYFAANASWVSQTKIRWTTWYKASAFNQSFDQGGWFRVKRSYSCFPGTCSSTKLNEPVANRTVTTYLGNGLRWRQSWMDGYWINGNGDWPRVGLAVRWVLDGQDAPPPTPSTCGAHTQLACWTGAACDPGLAAHNGACYACGTIGQPCCKDWGPVPTNGGWSGVCAQGVCGYPGGYCQ
jgi:hypothetical protein